MRINHNIAALNTHRQLGANNTQASKNLEKLSSGLKINRAGDDAAGLAISEKMRGQIRGLDMASKNAQDGISLIQTAEGALNETHSILQRMRELAVQSSNDTNTPTDRNELQKEVDQLSQELSRISNNTEFNTQKLLNGEFSGTFHIGANESQNLKLDIGDMRGFSLNVAGKVAVNQTDASVTSLAEGDYKITGNTTDGLKLLDSNGVQVGQSADGLTWNDMQGTPVEEFVFEEAVTSGSIKIDADGAHGKAFVDNDGLQAGKYTIDGTDVKDASGNKIGTYDATAFTVSNLSGDVLATFTTAKTEFEVGGVDISTQSSANSAVTTIQSAIDKVSAERSKLGAVQNRLEHTINNLGTSSENLTAAESRIRDVDMAKEMMEFTKNNILTQAAQAMLAQANQQPQGVLQLLR
ncbi:flagellin [Sporosarcina sp. NCCP-2222]|uniref:flagellin N-terminal helical domain-containing protein n=1 Tax=Sporosarcina sp. NCCP-2222 TaxID=2935073 RepID=UPI0020767E6E|nr:flagellin [Sporosarcina sp. NCCP-2222]GKV56694.1 flagellin [Sporosarcina sp. NCCP-2222]